MPSKTSGFISSQGTKIHYLAENLDAQEMSLLFVPGVMMPAWIWDQQIDYFSKNYRVIAIDPRSHGDSEQSSEGHYAFSLAKDIKSIVDELKLDPLVLIGWSLAVPEVVNYAAHFASEELVGLVLVDGLVGIDPSVPFYKATVEYWTGLQVERVAKTKEFIKSIFKQPQTEVFFEKLSEVALRMPTNTVMTLMENYILQDFRSLLPQINTPTLIATTEGPRLGYMKDMQKLIPHAHLEIFKSAGHALFVDQPKQFNHLLESFIENIRRK